MKKNKKLMIISIVLIVIIAGGVFAFFEYKEYKIKKMVDKGVEYLNKKEYEKATTTFDLVLDEKSDDKEALQLKDMVNKYLEAKKCFDNGDSEKANELIDELDKEDSNYKEFKEDVSKLKNDINSNIKKNKEIDNNINKIRDLIKEEKYEDANDIIDKLEKEKLSDIQSKQVSDLKGRIDSELDKQEEAKKEQEEQQKESNQNTGNESNQDTEQSQDSGKICDTSSSILRSKESAKATEIARAYANKIGMQDVLAMGVTEIPGIGKNGWGFVLQEPGEMDLYVDDYGTVYEMGAGDTAAREVG